MKYGESGVAAVQDLIDKGENIQLVTYNSNEEMLADVESGKLDAGVNDLFYQLQYNLTHPSLKIYDEVLREEQLRIVVRKGDTNLLKVINEVLKEMKDSGEADNLYNKWIQGN